MLKKMKKDETTLHYLPLVWLKMKLCWKRCLKYQGKPLRMLIPVHIILVCCHLCFVSLSLMMICLRGLWLHLLLCCTVYLGVLLIRAANWGLRSLGSAKLDHVSMVKPVKTCHSLLPPSSVSNSDTLHMQVIFWLVTCWSRQLWIHGEHS